MRLAFWGCSSLAVLNLGCFFFAAGGDVGNLAIGLLNAFLALYIWSEGV